MPKIPTGASTSPSGLSLRRQYDDQNLGAKASAPSSPCANYPASWSPYTTSSISPTLPSSPTNVITDSMQSLKLRDEHLLQRGNSQGYYQTHGSDTILQGSFSRRGSFSLPDPSLGYYSGDHTGQPVLLEPHCYTAMTDQGPQSTLSPLTDEELMIWDFLMDFDESIPIENRSSAEVDLSIDEHPGPDPSYFPTDHHHFLLPKGVGGLVPAQRPVPLNAVALHSSITPDGTSFAGANISIEKSPGPGPSYFTTNHHDLLPPTSLQDLVPAQGPAPLTGPSPRATFLDELRCALKSSNERGTNDTESLLDEFYQKNPLLAGCNILVKAKVASAKTILTSNASRKDVAKFECPLKNCDSTFTRKQNLWHHLKSHFGRKDQPCGKCGTAFITLSAAKRHENDHCPFSRKKATLDTAPLRPKEHQ